MCVCVCSRGREAEKGRVEALVVQSVKIAKQLLQVHAELGPLALWEQLHDLRAMKGAQRRDMTCVCLSEWCACVCVRRERRERVCVCVWCEKRRKGQCCNRHAYAFPLFPFLSADGSFCLVPLTAVRPCSRVLSTALSGCGTCRRSAVPTHSRQRASCWQQLTRVF